VQPFFVSILTPIFRTRFLTPLQDELTSLRRRPPTTTIPFPPAALEPTDPTVALILGFVFLLGSPFDRASDPPPPPRLVPLLPNGTYRFFCEDGAHYPELLYFTPATSMPLVTLTKSPRYPRRSYQLTVGPPLF
jgi:hypothetical protein